MKLRHFIHLAQWHSTYVMAKRTIKCCHQRKGRDRSEADAASLIDAPAIHHVISSLQLDVFRLLSYYWNRWIVDVCSIYWSSLQTHNGWQGNNSCRSSQNTEYIVGIRTLRKCVRESCQHNSFLESKISDLRSYSEKWEHPGHGSTTVSLSTQSITLDVVSQCRHIAFALTFSTHEDIAMEKCRNVFDWSYI